LKEEQIKAFDEILRNIENENYELKIKIEDLNHVMKAQKHNSPLITKNHILRSSTLQELRPSFNIIECEEQIKSLLKENKELENKSKNLLEIIKIKENKIEELQKHNEVFSQKNKETEEVLKRLKQETNNFKQEIINKRNTIVQVESVYQFNSNPINQEDINKVEENIELTDGLIHEKLIKSDVNNEFLSRNIQNLDINERKRSRLNVLKYIYII